MKYFVRKALKTSVDYAIVLVIYVIFLYTFVAITGDKFYNWLPVYSVVNFLLLFLILYNDYKMLAMKERKPQYNLNPYRLKGFYMGVLGFLPVVIAVTVLFSIRFEDELAARLAELVAKGFLGPVYFILRAGGETFLTYAGAMFTVPAIAALGYLAGYHNFSIRNLFGKKKETTSSVDKAYEPSPWNPAAKKKDKN